MAGTWNKAAGPKGTRTDSKGLTAPSITWTPQGERMATTYIGDNINPSWQLHPPTVWPPQPPPIRGNARELEERMRQELVEAQKELQQMGPRKKELERIIKGAQAYLESIGALKDEKPKAKKRAPKKKPDLDLHLTKLEKALHSMIDTDTATEPKTKTTTRSTPTRASSPKGAPKKKAKPQKTDSAPEDREETPGGSPIFH